MRSAMGLPIITQPNHPTKTGNNITMCFASYVYRLLPLLLLPVSLLGALSDNSPLNLVVAVPLTEDNEHVDPGWMHMASAMMAVDHFNTRDPAVVPELAMLLKDCDVQFGNVTVVDTGTNSHKAMEAISGMLRNGYFPDAIAGPYNEIPALELSALATGLKTPIVSHRASNYNLVIPEKHPYFTHLSADLYGGMQFLGRFLQHTRRDNYIAVVHGLDDSSVQRVEILRGILFTHGMEDIKSFSYLSPATPIEGSLNRDIKTALEDVEACGYRTIVWLTAHPDVDVIEMGNAAAELELDTGEHFWIFPGGAEISSIHKWGIVGDVLPQLEASWWRFLKGMAYLDQVERFEAVPDDAFNQSLHYQNATFVQKLRDINPIPSYYEKAWPVGMNSTFPPDDIFQLIDYPNEGTSYMYDSVMSIGIGACKAITEKSSASSITGDDLLQGIQSADFMGASGQVRFHNLQGNPGSRDGSTVYFGVLNILPYGIVDDPSRLVDFAFFYHPDTDEMRGENPFFYADGTTNPPALLRDPPPQNYLSPQARATGLSLMGIAIAATFFSAVWVMCYRKHSVVIAGQPPFLYLICLGSAMMSLLILMSSYDESYGWTDDMLDKACRAFPWLDSLGHILIYGSLFTKLWRVNEVLQFRRRQIRVVHVLWPAALLVFAAIVVLSVWTAGGNGGWERLVIDDVTGESIGQCTTGENPVTFAVPLAIINFTPTLLTCFMAWKTSDIDDLYSESKWIFSLVLVHLEVLVVGLPILVILFDLSSDGRFIGLSLLVVTFPLTNMGLIIGPKMAKVYKDKMPRRESSASRGARQHTRVSGITGGDTTSGGEMPTPRPSAEEATTAISGVYPQTVTMK